MPSPVLWTDTQTALTQTDPIGIAGGLNTYGFAAGDPVSYADPYGLCAASASDTIPEIGFCRKPIPQGGVGDVSLDIALNFLPWGKAVGSARPLFARLGGGLASLLQRRTAAHAANVATRLVGPDGALRISETVATRLAGQRGDDIPSLAIFEAIRHGDRAIDPQGVANHFMYTIGNRNGTLEVLVDESQNVINHVLYRARR